ncbi:MAG: sulfotransferase family 2 domain-containing protein [Verrucomicrobiota bacterium]|nr:sulfotransferase family 2 domain-containing protein [Verrucomicrobiota bacterium]
MPDQNETLIFLHIPKAGGSTISKILEQRYSRAETLTLDDRDRQIAQLKALPAAQRGQYRLIQGHLFFGLHRFIPGATTYITFLRRPVERVLSFYYYARSTPDHYLYPLLATERLDLKTLLARDLTLELRNEQTRLLAGDEWEDPQRIVTRAALELAKANLRTHFRVVGLLEEFDASLLLLRRTFGWHLPFYVKENVTKEKPDETSLNAETRRLVEDANSLDLELYEYARNLFDERRRAAGDSFAAELCHFRQLNRAYARSVPRRFADLLRRVGLHPTKFTVR